MSCPEYDAYAQFYDFVVPYRTRPDVEFYVEEASQVEGPILELGCGTGRILIPIARHGARIVGVDLSREMLSLCRQNLREEDHETQARVTLVRGDMRTVAFGERFALVTVPFRAFQHLLTLEDQLVTLATIRSHLVPGGRLILDLFNPALPFLVDDRFAVHPMVEPPFSMPDGRTVVRSHRTIGRDLHNQVREYEITHEVTDAAGAQESHALRFKLRYTFRFEAEHLLERSGFRTEALYADFDRKPYGSVYPGELIFVASAKN